MPLDIRARKGGVRLLSLTACTTPMAQMMDAYCDCVLRACAQLKLLDRPPEPARLFAAAWLAGVRLIDNIDVPVAG